MLLPAWLAVMLQVPTVISDSVLPLTVQTLVAFDVKPTARFELAVATSAGGAVPRVWLPGDVNVMVCAINGAAATVNEFVTGVAAVKLALPAWLAVMLQVPAATSVTVLPLTVQTLAVFDVKLTARPELAVATSAGAAVPRV